MLATRMKRFYAKITPFYWIPKKNKNRSYLFKTIKHEDPQMVSLIDTELKKQKFEINLIESDNFISLPVMQALGSHIQNSEGFPGRRLGLEKLDKIEMLAQKRALELFKLDPKVWEVNLECLSGALANTVALTSVLNLGDRVMAMCATQGGPLSHGAKFGETTLSSSADWYTWKHYGLDSDGRLDYKQVQKVSF